MFAKEEYLYRYRIAEIITHNAYLDFKKEVEKYTKDELENETFRVNLCCLYATKFSKELAKLELNIHDSMYFEGYIHYFIFSLDDVYTGDNFAYLYA